MEEREKSMLEFRFLYTSCNRCVVNIKKEKNKRQNSFMKYLPAEPQQSDAAAFG